MGEAHAEVRRGNELVALEEQKLRPSKLKGGQKRRMLILKQATML